MMALSSRRYAPLLEAWVRLWILYGPTIQSCSTVSSRVAFELPYVPRHFRSVAVGHCHLAYPSRGTPWALEECLGIADTVVLVEVGSTEACGWFEVLT